MDRPYHVLFISRRNSARSLMAEAVVNRHGGDNFRAFSAGVEPTDTADAVALEVLEQAGYPTQGLRPKHWSEFGRADAPPFDFVFTLSATASREKFPDWPGKPASAHWRYPDPLQADGDAWQRRREYGRTLQALERQMRIFMQLSFTQLDRIALQSTLDQLAVHHAEETSVT
jgi:arsenate reductase (thioredoxin)